MQSNRPTTSNQSGTNRQDMLVGLLRLRKAAGPDSQRQPELRGK
jgi:hypothetical protein